MFLIAEFLEQEPAAAGVVALVEAGVHDAEIEVFSDRPLELPPGLLDRPGHSSLAAVLGAALNGGLATAFIFYTQHAYPLVTGGMPLVSGWSTGVISYELTMAGAVAGAVLAFLWEAGLIRRRNGGPVPSLRDGSVFLRVRCPSESAGRAANLLSRAGAANVVRREES